MKSKLVLGLATLAILTMFATSSFAQVQITVTNSAPSPAEIATNRTAATSDTSAVGNGILVSGSLLAQSDLTTTNLLLTFPAPVSSAITVPAGDPIRITGATGVFAGATISTVNYVTGVVTLVLPPATANNSSGSFRLSGVRIDANGKSGAQTGTAQLSSGANNYILSNSTFSLIGALSPGIGSGGPGSRTGQPSNGTALIFNNQNTGTYADANASFVLAEGFAAAWKTQTQASTSGVSVGNGTQIRLTSANLPTGTTATVTLNPPTGLVAYWASSCGSGVNTGVTVQAFTSTTPGTTDTFCVDFSGTDTSAAETLQFDVVLSGTPSSALTAGTALTFTATMAPVGNAPTGIMNPTTSGGYPRFAAANTVITFGSIVSANTTMLIPYFAKGFGIYDFGIAVSNTNADPFGVTNGGATATGGAVTFTIYIRGVATPITLSTATLTSTQASGIVSGQIPAGGVFTGSLSQMLPSTAPADAVGYIFIQADFLNAHGIGYLIETSPSYHITSAAPVLVMDSPNRTARVGPTESLGF